MINVNARHLTPALVCEGEDERTMNDARNLLRAEFEKRKDRFIKRYGLIAVIVAALIVWTFAACSITGAVVKKQTTKEVTARVQSEMRSGFQNYLDQQDYEEHQAGFLTGDASFEAAVEELSGPMSQVITTYAQDFGISQDGLRTIGWVFCARYHQNSVEFGRTPQEILEKKSAWEGSVVNHGTRVQDQELTREIARDYLKGNYPDNYTTAMTFLNREAGGKVIARNEYNTGPHTIYWWYGK